MWWSALLCLVVASAVVVFRTPTVAARPEQRFVQQATTSACDIETIWGITSGGTAREYRLDGTTTGRTVSMSSYPNDIAVSTDGTTLYGLDSNGAIGNVTAIRLRIPARSSPTPSR